tara:strand:+ start:3329 stop:4543 length:1215 start_codon:yes stop_codon:yes gene_type:complete
MMLTVDQARTRILDAVSRMPAKKCGIVDSLGCILAQSVYAGENIPPFDNSAMDGYALIASDVETSSDENPVTLDVIETIPAGYAPVKQVKNGQATRIMTGAMMPSGADSVVMVEKTEAKEGGVDIFDSAAKAQNVRFVGESVKTGDLVMSAGKVIRPQEIAMLASLNISEIDIYQRPKVAVVSTGDELTPLGGELKPGKIRDSNRYGICAQLIEAGFEVIDKGICGDDVAELERTLRSALGQADVLITSGGVSVGDYDVVKIVLEKLGDINFWRVAMKPGKPQAFGLADGKPIFGLPGNPVSSLTVFELFVRPALFKMAGYTKLLRPTFKAVLETDIKNDTNRVNFMRAIIEKHNGRYHAKITGDQGSGILYSLVLANGLITIPVNQTIHAGETVDAQFFGDAF